MDQQRGSAPGVGSEDADAGVQAFFDRLGRALGAGDGGAIARMWEVPSLVVADQGLHAVQSTLEVEQFFSLAAAQYRERGIRETRADVTRVEWATERLALVRVRWPYLDASRNEIGEETTTYALRRGGDGQLRICAAVLHGEPARH